MDLLIRARGVALALVVVAAGCFEPRYTDGRIRCDETSGCPPGFTCWSDGRCHQGLEPPRVDAATLDAAVADAAEPADASPVDAAAVDVRPGDLKPPSIFDEAGGPGRLGATMAPGWARAIVSVGVQATGTSGGAGTPTVEWGIVPSATIGPGELP